MLLPLRSLIVLIEGSLATRVSAAPMTSWIHTTLMSIWALRGAETPLVAGDEPRREMSALPEPKPWSTAPPEGNSVQTMFALGRQVSSIRWSFTTRSGFAIF